MTLNKTKTELQKVAPPVSRRSDGRVLRVQQEARRNRNSYARFPERSPFRTQDDYMRGLQPYGFAAHSKEPIRARRSFNDAMASGVPDPGDGIAGESAKGAMMSRLWEFGSFVRKFRMKIRYGDLSRAQLRLLRLQLRGDAAECDWLARPPDLWDSQLPASVGERNASQQALKDAIDVRDLLFSTLPDLNTAAFRVYRRSAGDEQELIIAGSVTREERVPFTVRSLAMRAKLLGFRFWMDDGILETLQADG